MKAAIKKVNPTKEGNVIGQRVIYTKERWRERQRKWNKPGKKQLQDEISEGNPNIGTKFKIIVINGKWEEIKLVWWERGCI